MNSLTKEEEIFLVKLIEKFKKIPTDKKQYILSKLEGKAKGKEAARVKRITKKLTVQRKEK